MIRNIKKLRNTIYTIIEGLIILNFILMFIGCIGNKPGNGYVNDTPNEIEKLITRKYKKAVYAVGTASSAEEGLAIRKATLQARSEIAREFKTQIDVLQKSYEESINDRVVEEYQETIEIFAALEISGSVIAKSMVRKEKNNNYYAKVLVVVSAKQLKSIIDEKMRNYTSFKASQAYKALEERVRLEKNMRQIAGE